MVFMGCQRAHPIRDQRLAGRSRTACRRGPGGLPKDTPPRRGTPECDAWQKKRAVSQNRYFATAVGDRAVHATDDLKIGKLYRLGFSGHRGPSDRSTDRRGANQRILLSRGKLGPEKPRVGQQARGAGQYLFATLDSSVQ